MAKKTIHIMNTAFRDGFQSVYGARVLTEDFMPAVKACADAGQTHFEAGGGARFQAPFFYCNESAFDMMDRFREVAGPEANLQTLANNEGVNRGYYEYTLSTGFRIAAHYNVPANITNYLSESKSGQNAKYYFTNSNSTQNSRANFISWFLSLIHI